MLQASVIVFNHYFPHGSINFKEQTHLDLPGVMALRTDMVQFLDNNGVSNSHIAVDTLMISCEED